MQVGRAKPADRFCASAPSHNIVKTCLADQIQQEITLLTGVCATLTQFCAMHQSAAKMSSIGTSD